MQSLSGERGVARSVTAGASGNYQVTLTADGSSVQPDAMVSQQSVDPSLDRQEVQPSVTETGSVNTKIDDSVETNQDIIPASADEDWDVDEYQRMGGITQKDPLQPPCDQSKDEPQPPCDQVKDVGRKDEKSTPTTKNQGNNENIKRSA